MNRSTKRDVSNAPLPVANRGRVLRTAGREKGFVIIIETPRLRLRPWIDADVAPFIAMMTDPEVTRHVSPATIPRASAEAAATHYRLQLETNGYGWWPIDVKDGASFAGVIMLDQVKFKAAFTPAIEVGWLLPRERWGSRYATEGARAALHHAFITMELSEVVALTAASNIPSQRAMQRLGMTHDPTFRAATADDLLQRAVRTWTRGEGNDRLK